MSEADVVEKVGELMRTLDDVRKYRELAYAMVDFLAIMVIVVIASILIVFLQGVYDVTSYLPAYGPAFPVGGTDIPSSALSSVAVLVIIAGGLLGGVLWVDRRVGLTKTSEWQQTLEEGVPGAVRLLSELDWESELGMVSTSRVAYLFYAVLKVAGYSLVVYFFLLIVCGFSGLFYLVPSAEELLGPASIITVLIFSRRNLEAGFRRLRSLDLLFWDLRGFYSEFERAEFNKA